MAFQSCWVLFKDPIDLPLSCLNQTKHRSQYHNKHHMLSSFVRNDYYLSGSSNLDDPLYRVNRISLKFLPRLIKPPGNILCKLSLVPAWNITNAQNDNFLQPNTWNQTINQFQYIKIQQKKTSQLEAQRKNSTTSLVISRSLVLRSINLGWFEF